MNQSTLLILIMRKSDHLAISGLLLTLFLTVYDTNSVGRAAEVLDINQSSVSHGLENLRGILGDQLFIKQGRGITPTERAIALAPEVRSMLASLEGMIRKSDYDPKSDDRAVTLAGNVDAFPDVNVDMVWHRRSDQSGRNIWIRELVKASAEAR